MLEDTALLPGIIVLGIVALLKKPDKNLTKKPKDKQSLLIHFQTCLALTFSPLNLLQKHLKIRAAFCLQAASALQGQRLGLICVMLIKNPAPVLHVDISLCSKPCQTMCKENTEVYREIEWWYVASV